LTIGASLFLIAVGAILKFAVTWTLVGIDLHVAGVVLMVVGALGLLLGLFLLLSNRTPGVGPPPPAL
jgi:membrane-bound ClpP family serine protease